MALIMPSEAIARRWNGALESRLKRAPLEEFLRARALKIEHAGVARDTDNLVRAVVFIVDAGIAAFCDDHEDGLDELQQAEVGEVACGVSRGLAALIHEPAAWRTVALVSAAQLLTPWIGLTAAAYAATTAARKFDQVLHDSSKAADGCIGETASLAVASRDSLQVGAVALLISQRLALAANSPISAAPQQSEKVHTQR
jgi:hypothetical protein